MSIPSLAEPPYSAEEIEIIKGYLLQNISTETNTFTKMARGKSVIKSIPGCVIASPSIPGPNFNQDYLFHWVRDGAIVMNEVAYLYDNAQEPTEKALLKKHILNYIEWVKIAQAEPPLNGVDVLGEPKFNLNGKLWVGQWSRPQNDGPALRAIALIHIINSLIKEGEQGTLIDTLYHSSLPSLIKTDLEYTAKHCLEKSIGAWEEVSGLHFFTMAVQRKALFAGADLAGRLEDTEAAEYYLAQVKYLEDSMNCHWKSQTGFYDETLEQRNSLGGGLDITVLMGLMYGRLRKPVDLFALSNVRSLSSAYYLRYCFENLYQINVKDREAKLGGPLIGRYQNDIYDGYQLLYGNPWFLTTHVFAEFYYAVAEELMRIKQVEVSFLTKQFFQQVDPTLKLSGTEFITAKNNPEVFYQLIRSLIKAADDMLLGAKNHTATYEDGTPLHMSEQIDRCHGHQVSAQDLTWSYCTLLTAMQVRARAVKLLPAQ
jgi:glucoamylase